jgi:hypothetical protein
MRSVYAAAAASAADTVTDYERSLYPVQPRRQ